MPLTWSEDGVKVTKTFMFQRGEVRDRTRLRRGERRQPPLDDARPYAQILRNDPRTKRSMFNVESYAFHGPAVFDGKKYRKLDTAEHDDSHLSIDVTNGWIAALQHHFVSAIVPPHGSPWHFALSAHGRPVPPGREGPMHEVAAGCVGQIRHRRSSSVRSCRGSWRPSRPSSVASPTTTTCTSWRSPCSSLLDAVHGFIGNWGIAIILVTFLLKLVFYPLSEASGRSMAKMKQLQPRIKNLQETYKDDAEKLGRAMMELYQREKINPIAGCLPIIIQIPVFLAFYWVLLESVEMRQAPFAFWIHDLSSRDPCFVLPLIMAAAMFAAVQAEPHAAGPGPGQGVHVHAAGDVGHVRVLPGGTGAVLGDQHRACRSRSSGTSIAALQRRRPRSAPHRRRVLGGVRGGSLRSAR